MWGTGGAYREFLHVDDLAAACLFLMEHYDDDSHINVGTGVDLSIQELAETIRESSTPVPSSCGTRPSPTARRASCSTSSRLRALGWAPQIELRDGLTSTYQWFLDQVASDGTLRGIEPQFA